MECSAEVWVHAFNSVFAMGFRRAVVNSHSILYVGRGFLLLFFSLKFFFFRLISRCYNIPFFLFNTIVSI